MTELDGFSAEAEAALNSRDFKKLEVNSERFLDYFAENFMTDEWKTFSRWEECLPALIGLEVSHFGLGREVAMVPRILDGISATKSYPKPIAVLSRRWALIFLPLEIANIERDWKGCLQSIVQMVSDAPVLQEEASKFQIELFNRAGVACMSQLKQLMHQVAQYQALMGSILTELEVDSEVRRLVAEWFFASKTERLIPDGYSV